jgi:hypothetical protein
MACPDPDMAGMPVDDVVLAPGQATEISVMARGRIDVSDCGLSGYGFFDAAPTLTLAPVPREGGSLVLETRSNPNRCDPVLLVRDAAGTWHFNDDTRALDPRIHLPDRNMTDGRIGVWIGTFNQVDCDVSLVISYSTPSAPAPAPQDQPPALAVPQYELSAEYSMAANTTALGGSWTVAADTSPIVPTRAFLPPHQFPPAGYRGYGLLAFPSLATSEDIERHLAICTAFVASFLDSGDAAAATARQFLTGWPVRSAEVAARLDDMALDDLSEDISALCRLAVGEYDLETAQFVLSTAERHGGRFSGRGPYLLAWSPANGFGASNALVLTLDLSRVDDYDAALVFMNEWKSDIQQDFEILSNGFSLDRIRVKIRRWADAYGQGYLSLLTGE